jgi:2-C-methyl-D-erythritol 4-phosphate cytidylyltransferase
MTHRFFAVVPAAGVGSRFGSQIPKQYTEIAGQAVLLHTVQLLLANETLAGVAVVLSPDDGYFKDLNLPAWAQTERLHVLYCGGDSRAESGRSNGCKTKIGYWCTMRRAAACLKQPCSVCWLRQRAIAMGRFWRCLWPIL